MILQILIIGMDRGGEIKDKALPPAMQVILLVTVMLAGLYPGFIVVLVNRSDPIDRIVHHFSQYEVGKVETLSTFVAAEGDGMVM